jgi:beta-xylosidase
VATTTFRARAKVGGLAVALAMLSPAFTTSAQAASPHGDHKSLSVRGPVINSNFPDPDLLKVERVYHAYATNDGGKNVQHQTSTDLVHWTVQPDVAPTLGAWVKTTCTFAPGGATDRCVWAPEVSAVSGGYVLYYAARDAASDKQCIGVSRSSSPNGPFVPVGTTPLICPVDQGGAIDPSTYVENGQRYLLWKADGNCCNLPAIIYIQPTSADGLTLTGPAVKLIQNDLPFEGRVVEAPTLIKHDGTYYLFYSANDFSGGNYKTGYATSNTLMGPYTKSLTPLMTTDRFRDKVIGPGGQDVITGPNGNTVIVFHGWDPTYTYRAMYVRGLTWTNGVPAVEGLPVRYEAEKGVVVDARVLPDNTASGGAKVGGLDNPDSSVTVQVFAKNAGPANLAVRFANGSLDPSGYPVKSSDYVSVNGVRVGTIVFWHTTWGNWQFADFNAVLHQGWNSVTLTKKTFYAEIDAVDVS